MRTVLARVDGAVGAVPMVRLVLVWLGVVSAAAIALSVPGVVPFPTLPLLATLATALVATFLSNRLMAAIVHARPHDESALVTGLILFLLFYPTVAPTELLLIAAAGLVANASKYLLRIGGRHVLNPAALGAFAVGLTGVVSTAWWVATPALLPFTAVATLLIALRMRLLGPVLVLIGIGAALVVVGQAARGTPLGDASANALLRYPLVFLAGFMLTEPITLPPRQWHRYVVAAVVAVGFAVPSLVSVQLLTFYPTPEAALLLGNVVAVLLARPAAAPLRFAGRRQLTPTSVEYAFAPERRLPHRAGQYLELHLPHASPDRRGVRRSLTIVSPPEEADGTVKVAVRTSSPGSTFKRALDGLPVGSPLRAVTVTGGFVLPADRTVPLLLVASGIGITPFVSQLRHDAAEVAAGAAPRDVLLVDRVPSADEIAYLPELVATGVRVLLVCPDPGSLPPLPEHWHVARDLDDAALAGVLPEPGRRTAYVSGSPAFVHRTRALLRRVGVRRVRTDAFSGY